MKTAAYICSVSTLVILAGVAVFVFRSSHCQNLRGAIQASATRWFLRDGSDEPGASSPQPASVRRSSTLGSPLTKRQASPGGPPQVTSATTFKTSIGKPVAYVITASTAASRFHAVGLPEGLTVNPETGEILGIPKVAGIYTVTLSAVSDLRQVTQELILAVNPPPPVITSPGTTFAGDLGAAIEAGKAFDFQIHATNQPETYRATNLPTGLTLDRATGRITGSVAVPGTFPIGLSAINAGGTGNATLTLVVDDGGHEVEATQ